MQRAPKFQEAKLATGPVNIVCWAFLWWGGHWFQCLGTGFSLLKCIMCSTLVRTVLVFQSQQHAQSQFSPFLATPRDINLNYTMSLYPHTHRNIQPVKCRTCDGNVMEVAPLLRLSWILYWKPGSQLFVLWGEPQWILPKCTAPALWA